jgi:hypothetical protein
LLKDPDVLGVPLFLFEGDLGAKEEHFVTRHERKLIERVVIFHILVLDVVTHLVACDALRLQSFNDKVLVNRLKQIF